MSIHVNPDGSNTEGMKVEPSGTFIAHALNIGAAAVVSIPASNFTIVAPPTQPTSALQRGATQAIVQADPTNTGPVRYTLDGTAPTTAAGGGIAIAAGAQVALNMADAASAKFIGPAASVINVTFTM